MKITTELTHLFLQGGQVVHRETYTCNTYLIRMPKGKFIKDERDEYKNNSFEYVWAQNYIENNLLSIGGWLNNTLRGAKKEMVKNHTEHCYSIYRKKNK